MLLCVHVYLEVFVVSNLNITNHSSDWHEESDRSRRVPASVPLCSNPEASDQRQSLWGAFVPTASTSLCSNPTASNPRLSVWGAFVAAGRSRHHCVQTPQRQIRFTHESTKPRTLHCRSPGSEWRRRKRSTIFRARGRRSHRQSDEHWNSFKGKQIWGNVWETWLSAYGIFRAHRCNLELNLAEQNSLCRTPTSGLGDFQPLLTLRRRHPTN